MDPWNHCLDRSAKTQECHNVVARLHEFYTHVISDALALVTRSSHTADNVSETVFVTYHHALHCYHADLRTEKDRHSLQISFRHSGRLAPVVGLHDRGGYDTYLARI
jgi:hypothetical protein